MKYRVASLLASQAANTAGTEPIDINMAKPISRLTVQFKGLNNGTAPTAHPAKMVSKIELMDGSDVLASLSGVQAQTVNWHDTGRMPHTVLNYLNDVYAIATFNFDFGRWLYDPILAFDPKKFENPQLKITHDKALGGTSPDAGLLSVFAHAFDEKEASPTGFLMSKQSYSYTLVAGASKPIDLATDWPYRKLIIQSLSNTLQPWEQFNQVKLSQDNDAKVIINDEKTSDLLKLLRVWPQFTETITGRTKNGSQVFPCTPSYERIASLTGVAADADAYFDDTYGCSVSIADSAAATVQAIISGLAPHGSLCIPFGKQDDLDDYFAIGEGGSLRLTLKAGGSASGTCEIITQQLRSY